MQIKKPINYPRIPRVKRKPGTRGAKGPTSTPVEFVNYSHADWSINGSMLNSDYILRKTRVVIGTDGKSYVSTPDWKVKLAKGLDASSAYSRQGVSRFVPASYQCRSTVNGYLSVGNGTVICGSYPAQKPYDDLVSQATGRVKHKLQGHVGNAQLLAPLAESREIHRLVRSINGLGMNALGAMLTARKTRGRSLTKLFGEIWLGFGFGVNPLLKDIQSACDSILHYQTRQDYRVKLSGGASMDWVTANGKGIADTAAYQAYYGFTHSTQHIQSVLLTAGISLNVRTAASYSVTDHLGLKISQVPSTAWELTPFSWVVDYFVTVGPWLDDMFYTLPGSLNYCTLAKKYRSITTGDMFFQKVNQFDSGTVDGTGGGSLVECFAFSREVLSSLPSASLRVKSVDEIAIFGITKLLNLASVIAGRHGT